MNHFRRIRRLIFTIRPLEDALRHVIIKVPSGPIGFVEMFRGIRQPRNRVANMARFRGVTIIEHHKEAFHFGYE